jgi:hypothetical protein
MAKKLAVGARKAAMAGKRSATKRELIDTGREAAHAKRGGSTPRPRPARRPKPA